MKQWASSRTKSSGKFCIAYLIQINEHLSYILVKWNLCPVTVWPICFQICVDSCCYPHRLSDSHKIVSMTTRIGPDVTVASLDGAVHGSDLGCWVHNTVTVAWVQAGFILLPMFHSVLSGLSLSYSIILLPLNGSSVGIDNPSKETKTKHREHLWFKTKRCKIISHEVFPVSFSWFPVSLLISLSVLGFLVVVFRPLVADIGQLRFCCQFFEECSQ